VECEPSLPPTRLRWLKWRSTGWPAHGGRANPRPAHGVPGRDSRGQPWAGGSKRAGRGASRSARRSPCPCGCRQLPFQVELTSAWCWSDGKGSGLEDHRLRRPDGAAPCNCAGLGAGNQPGGGLAFAAASCVCCGLATIRRWLGPGFGFRACLPSQAASVPGSGESKRGPGSRSRAVPRKVSGHRSLPTAPRPDCCGAAPASSSTERMKRSVTRVWCPARILVSCSSVESRLCCFKFLPGRRVRAVEHLPRLVQPPWPSWPIGEAGADPETLHLAVVSKGPERWAGNQRGVCLEPAPRPARWMGGRGRRNCGRRVLAAVDGSSNIILKKLAPEAF